MPLTAPHRAASGVWFTSRSQGGGGLSPEAAPGTEPLFYRRLTYDTGLRCMMMTSSEPVVPPLFDPDGWPESYGLAWVGQPV